MNRINIKPNDLLIKAADIWLNRWWLLTAGDCENYNTMTVAWGSVGGMWGKPFVQVVVRPQRYTYEFMEKYKTFTLCSFPFKYRNDLQKLGTFSGRHGDKIAQTQLTIEPSIVVEAPRFEEADLAIECRKIYLQDMNPEGFIERSIDENYPEKDYHRIYFGEILHIEGTADYKG
jgi:flavin reductase (DIM6/NTAB) family NADH-FMN oxidoreductase RutF